MDSINACFHTQWDNLQVLKTCYKREFVGLERYTHVYIYFSYSFPLEFITRY